MSASLRIAVYHNLPSGGAKRVLRQQVAGLVGRGHVVDAFVASTAEEGFQPLKDVATTVMTWPHPAPPPRERMLAGRASPLEPLRWLGFLRSMRRLEREMAAAIDARGYDVALVHPSQFTQAPWTLSALRTPALYYCHEPLRAAYEPGIASLPVRLALRATLGRVDRRAVRAAALVAANSAFTAAAVLRLYGRPARVNYPGVDTDLFTPASMPPLDYVLAVGALHPLKAMDFLVRALGRVPPAVRPTLRIVSDRAREAERTRIERLAALVGVRLQLAFRVSEEELVTEYRAARLVLCAAHREPFGLVALEAMACGRPVLAVRDGGFTETIVDGTTGYLEDRDEVSFAARIGGLLANAEAMEERARGAALLVRERWSWARSVEELERLLLELAPGGRTEMKA